MTIKVKDTTIVITSDTIKATRFIDSSMFIITLESIDLIVIDKLANISNMEFKLLSTTLN